MMVSIRAQKPLKKRPVHVAIGITVAGERECRGLWNKATAKGAGGFAQGGGIWSGVLFGGLTRRPPSRTAALRATSSAEHQV
jgi:hypothetical protein